MFTVHLLHEIIKFVYIALGKGVQVWKKSGSRYDGDWCEGKRHGFGMYSVLRDEQQMKEYSGGWKNDKRHVCKAEGLKLLCMHSSELTE